MHCEVLCVKKNIKKTLYIYCGVLLPHTWNNCILTLMIYSFIWRMNIIQQNVFHLFHIVEILRTALYYNWNRTTMYHLNPCSETYFKQKGNLQPLCTNHFSALYNTVNVSIWNFTHYIGRLKKKWDLEKWSISFYFTGL